MALRRRSTGRVSASIWPGFVDAMSALLLVLMFMLTIFMIVQFMLRETISGQETELDALAAELTEIAQALGSEQQRSFQLEGQVSDLDTSLEGVRSQAELQAVLITNLTSKNTGLSEDLATRQAEITAFEAQVATLLTERDSARVEGAVLTANVESLETDKNRLISEQEALQLVLASARDEIDEATETARLAAARREALDALVVDLRNRVSEREVSLADTLADLESSQGREISLSERLANLQVSLSDEAAERQVVEATAAGLKDQLTSLEQQISRDEIERLAELAAAQALQEKLSQVEIFLTAEEQARLAEVAAAEVLRQRLSNSETAFSEEEIARLAEAAAAEKLREKLRNADDELTAMTLSLEKERREAEELLTLVAAANALEDSLNERIATALLTEKRLNEQIDSAQDGQVSVTGQLADAEAELAMAVLARDQMANRLQAALKDIQDAIDGQNETLLQVSALKDDLASVIGERDTLSGTLSDESTRRTVVEDRVVALEITLAEVSEERDALAFSLEQVAGQQGDIENRFGEAETALRVITIERDDLIATATATSVQNADLLARLKAAETALIVAQSETEVLRSTLGDEETIRRKLAIALAASQAADLEVDRQFSEAERRAILLATANASLEQEEAKSADGLRKLAVLNAQVAEMRGQLATLQALLEDAKTKDGEAQIEITNLGSRVNAALARVASEQRIRAQLEEDERKRLEKEAVLLAEEARQLESEARELEDQAKLLERYRSDFFGQIREVLGDREGVEIVGDRFVFSSEVLFDPSSAVLADEGKVQIEHVAAILNEISASIPPEIDWVIRVDGHTDSTPLSGTGRYRDNWELSQGRALAVVRYMTDALGFDARRLAATGFGEFQPIAEGDSPEALAQNRRIEMKLTER
ncbi:MAG: peptidoglycan -binding protein [Paracoccaceae bacterium]